MKVTVVDYNSRWPEMFQRESEAIRRILGENALGIFHIGSTAVPGLKAKPIVDIMPVVLDLGRVDDCQAAFAALGYAYMGEFGMPGRRYLRKGGEARTHQIHIFRYDNAQDILRHLAVRDYLRCHADVREAYGRLKSALAQQNPDDIEGYCGGKDGFVKGMERDALAWHWKACERSAHPAG